MVAFKCCSRESKQLYKQTVYLLKLYTYVQKYIMYFWYVHSNCILLKYFMICFSYNYEVIVSIKSKKQISHTAIKFTAFCLGFKLNKQRFFSILFFWIAWLPSVFVSGRNKRMCVLLAGCCPQLFFHGILPMYFYWYFLSTFITTFWFYVRKTSG